MKHLCSNEKLPSFFTLILHDLFLLCSFFISHPLILVYLLLLFPYLLKLLFLLYPLLFSTFLLLTSTYSEFPSTHSSAVLNFLRSKLVADEGKSCLTEQLCSMVFIDSHLHSYQMEPNPQIAQFVCFSQSCNLLEDSKAKEDKAEKLSEKIPLKVRKEHSRRPSEILQRDGSMRKEKEWKRTLACKLFEERMTYKLCEERKAVDGAEEMDLLWEAYEVDADKTKKQRKEKTEEEEEEKEEEEEEGMTGQLCCLQALKLSGGKMNLGVGRPSLVKVSMALKGMSVFHRGGRRRRIAI